MPSCDMGCQALTGFPVPVAVLPAVVLVTFPPASLAERWGASGQRLSGGVRQVGG